MKKISFLLLLAALSFAHTATAQWGEGMKGEGDVVTENWDIESFSSLGLSLAGEVFVSRGNKQSVRVEGQKNILDNIKRELHGNAWEIKFKDRVRDHKGLKFYITVPSLRSIGVAGSGKVIGKDAFTGLDKFDASVSGSGDIEFNVSAGSVTSSISGSGTIDLEGKTTDLEVNISGSGDFMGFELSAETCTVSTAGSGNTQVNASKNLKVSIAGSGDVRYKGTPKVKSSVAGSGDVEAVR